MSWPPLLIPFSEVKAADVAKRVESKTAIIQETTWNDSRDPLKITTGSLHRIYATYDRVIRRVHASVSSANAGGTTEFDIKVDGVSVLSADLSIPDLAFESAIEVPAVTVWNVGSYMTVEVTGVSGGASKATVTVEWRRRSI